YYPKLCAWNGDSSGKQVEQTWGVFNDVFCAGKETTFKFIEDVLDEVMALFPSKYIHVGGDECPKENWKRCPFCQKRIKTEKLKDEHGLQSYFIQRIEKYLNSKGRALIGWDEILEGGLAQNATVMSWRGEQGGIDAARQHHNVIMTPGGWCYFDHSQSENEDSVTIGGYTPIEKVYSYEPVPDSLSMEQSKYILGAQGNVWTEYMGNEKKVEYMIFPRMSALSEVLWSPKQNPDWKDFEKRLMIQFKRYDLWHVNYSNAYFELKTSVLPTKNYNGVLWKIESKFDKRMFMNFNGGDSIWGYTEPQLIQKTAVARAYFNMDNQTVEVSQSFHFNKATGKKISLTNEPSKNYPGEGAFTLVDGVWNEKGLSRSKELLGFLGTDCEAVIDLGKPEIISNVIVHVLKEEESWIWQPQSVEIFSSTDGQNFTSMKMTNDFILSTGDNGTMKVEFPFISSQFVKVVVRNWGEIPQGNPGAGFKAWLFVDEIEVN
ncbi:MAG TPA: family 20 glycosylhydrolase, partial [Chitinophagaceae bacterium]|nr:family 20 glycosylhydrolase [Chitinophagaceae bacterium]